MKMIGMKIAMATDISDMIIVLITYSSDMIIDMTFDMLIDKYDY